MREITPDCSATGYVATSRSTPSRRRRERRPPRVLSRCTSLAPGMPEMPSGEPVLLGTVVGGRGTQALLQLDPLSGPARLYAVGDRDGGYLVVSIAPRSVVLAGPRGRVTLRLDPQEDRP